jgi:hypothetical protein
MTRGGPEKVTRGSQQGTGRCGPSCSWQQCAAPKAAPSVKLTNGLACANMDRRRRVTGPIFPHTRRPAGPGELTKPLRQGRGQRVDLRLLPFQPTQPGRKPPHVCSLVPIPSDGLWRDASPAQAVRASTSARNGSAMPAGRMGARGGADSGILVPRDARSRDWRLERHDPRAPRTTPLRHLCVRHRAHTGRPLPGAADAALDGRPRGTVSGLCGRGRRARERPSTAR